MKFFLRVFSSFLIVFLLFSCSQKPAKIVNRSKNVYSKNNAKNRDVRKVEKPKSREVEVAESDTVYTVSKKYQVPIQDIIKQNNLKAPYNFKGGEKLTLPAPTYHEVKSGETLYAISRQYNMKIDNIIELNDLKEPYSVKTGQKLKIANVVEKKTDEKLKCDELNDKLICLIENKRIYYKTLKDFQEVKYLFLNIKFLNKKVAVFN
jgi:LysM repeat protein